MDVKNKAKTDEKTKIIEDKNKGKLELIINKETGKQSLDKKILNIDNSKKPEPKDVQVQLEDKPTCEAKDDKQEEKGKKGKGKDISKGDEGNNIIKSEVKSDETKTGKANTNGKPGAGLSNKNVQGNKSVDPTSYTTDQASIDSLYKTEEQRRIYDIASGSVLQDQIQSDLKAQRIVADNAIESKTVLGIELGGSTFIPSYNGTRKVVNACPSLLKIVSSKTFNAENLPHKKSRYPYLNDMPIIQNSRDTFAEGTDVIRTILEAQNCNTTLKIDPQEQIKSKRTLFRNVLLSQPGAVNPEYTTDSETNIQHVFTAIFAYLPELVRSCRVIYEMEPPFHPMLQMIGNDRYNIFDEILNHIAIYKFPQKYGVHLMLGAVDHSLEWFQDDIVEMLNNDVTEYVFGETRTRSELRLGRKREVESVEATDQFAAALLHIDKLRRMAYKLDIRTYITWLYQFSVDGVVINYIDNHDDADYEVEGITLADSHSFIFAFLTSKQFQTAMIEKLVTYVVDFNLLKSISLSENLKINRGDSPSQTREQLVSEMQSRLESVDVSTFVRLLVYDVLAIFVPVRYTIRATINDELANFPEFFMNLCCMAIAPNIFAQNKHIILYNICNFLYNIEYEPYMQFQNQHGFSSTKLVPDVIDEDAYKNGEIPKIIDPSIKTNNKFVGRMRSLLRADGEVFTLKDQTTLKMPRLETKPQGYIPYKRVERTAGYANTPMQEKLWNILKLVNDVGISYTKVKTSDRRTTISDYIKWVRSLKPLMKEFSAMIHYEGNFIYRLILRHFACVYTDIKSPTDYDVTEKLRLAIRSDSESDMEPFLIEREPIKIPYTLPLSCILTIEGIYSVINRHQANDVRITVPDPQVIFKEFYGIVKGARNMCEVLAMSRHILRDDNSGILKRLSRFAQIASRKVVYKEVLRMMAEYTKNMPPDFLIYAEESITYTNNLQFWDPYVVFVNKTNTIMHVDNEPSIMGNALILSDEFLAQEIDVVSDLLFNSSFLFHINRGIRIFRQMVDCLKPGLPPKKWETYQVCITGFNNEILRIGTVLNEKRIMFALREKGSDRDTEYYDLTPCNMPRVLFICDHPAQISPKYRDELIRLVKDGVFGFQFNNFWYQATTYYGHEPPSGYPDVYIEQIFMTFDDTLRLILFPDTSRKIMHYDAPPVKTPYQYLWTDEDIQTDILMRDVSGMRPNPIAYTKPRPENWMLGKKGPSVMPKFSNNTSKTKSGVPNFLNTVVAHRKDTINYTFPPVEIYVPRSLLG